MTSQMPLLATVMSDHPDCDRADANLVAQRDPITQYQKATIKFLIEMHIHLGLYLSGSVSYVICHHAVMIADKVAWQYTITATSQTGKDRSIDRDRSCSGFPLDSYQQIKIYLQALVYDKLSLRKFKSLLSIYIVNSWSLMDCMHSPYSAI